jgi:hypothetical protein
MTNQKAALGATATFSIAVSGAGPMTFQWFENGNPVGITSAPSFTTAPLQASDNGAVFTVTVSNAGGSVNGSSAKLTVTSGATQYAITASAGANGAISPSGTVKVAQGASQVFTITPAAGYVVQGVTVDGQSAGAVTTYTFTDVEAKHTIAATFIAQSSMVNLALHQPTFHSALEADMYSSDYAVDGNLGTRWSSSQDDAAWMTVDLGSVRKLDRVILHWENAYGKAYRIEVSNDNVDWSQPPVYSTTTGDGGTDDLTFTEASGRYVRMQGVLRATGYGYSLYEFEVYDMPPQGPVFATQPQDRTVSVGGTAKFSVTMSGSGPFKYQWRKNGANVAGATKASYTTPPATAADNGSKYDVVVTSGGLSATSSAATLKVK